MEDLPIYKCEGGEIIIIPIGKLYPGILHTLTLTLLCRYNNCYVPQNKGELTCNQSTNKGEWTNYNSCRQTPPHPPLVLSLYKSCSSCNAPAQNIFYQTKKKCCNNIFNAQHQLVISLASLFYTGENTWINIFKLNLSGLHFGSISRSPPQQEEKKK